MITDFLLIIGERRYGKMTRVLVLGKGGMLGSMVFSYLSQDEAYEVKGTEKEEFNADKFLKDNSKFLYIKGFDYLINCIGIIKPYCKDDDREGVIRAIKINALFPHELAKFCRNSTVKIIQIATDCVFSGRVGNYDESSPHDPIDVYGRTKSLGEILDGIFLNIRCSIIGPELKNKLGLLEWFLSQKEESKVKGFTHHKWNGVTTLQFAKLCQKIIEKNMFDELIKTNHVFHFTLNNSVNKYELLLLFNKVFKKNIIIEQVDNIGSPKDLTLKTRYQQILKIFEKSTIEQALVELKEYMDKKQNDYS